VPSRRAAAWCFRRSRRGGGGGALINRAAVVGLFPGFDAWDKIAFAIQESSGDIDGLHAGATERRYPPRP
jgi:hypothetical protein